MEASNGWDRSEIGGKVSFERRRRHEGVTVSRAVDDDGIDVDLDNSHPYQGCSHCVNVTDEMLRALGYVRVGDERTNHEGGGR